MYDSLQDTLLHINTVQVLLDLFRDDLDQRATYHDASKTIAPEKEGFDRCTPLLAGTTYGTPEYDEGKALLGDALAHHYEMNDHHPEHHPNGIADMDLVQIVEMFFDWWASSMRHKGGDIRTSIHKNAERFGYSPELTKIFLNTVDVMEELVNRRVTWYT